MKSLAIIPARSGSKRLPGKNKMPIIAGRSLVDQACHVAASVGDYIISTDDPDITEQNKGHVELRKLSLCGDKVDLGDVVYDHALNHPDVDYFIILQPTTPVRTPLMVHKMLAYARAHDLAGCISVTETVPWRWTLSGEAAQVSWYHPAPYPRSQDVKLESSQEINSVTIVRADFAKECRRWGLPLGLCILPSYATLDIDNERDLIVARALLPEMLALLDDDTLHFRTVRRVNGTDSPPGNRCKL